MFHHSCLWSGCMACPGQQGWSMPPSVSFWNWAGSNHAEVTVLHFFAGAHPYKLLYVNFDYFLSLKYTKMVSCAPVHFNIHKLSFSAVQVTLRLQIHTGVWVCSGACRCCRLQCSMHCNFYSEIYWQKYSAYWQLKDIQNPKTPTTLKINHQRYKSCWNSNGFGYWWMSSVFWSYCLNNMYVLFLWQSLVNW